MNTREFIEQIVCCLAVQAGQKLPNSLPTMMMLLLLHKRSLSVGFWTKFDNLSMGKSPTNALNRIALLEIKFICVPHELCCKHVQIDQNDQIYQNGQNWKIDQNNQNDKKY